MWGREADSRTGAPEGAPAIESDTAETPAEGAAAPGDQGGQAPSPAPATDQGAQGAPSAPATEMGDGTE